MTANKTIETTEEIESYFTRIADENKRNDCRGLAELFAAETGFPARMWGTSIVGFGSYDYKYESGREGTAPLAGFSARANAISLYISKFDGRDELLATMGKHTTGKGCVYIKKLSDVDLKVLGRIVRESLKNRIDAC